MAPGKSTLGALAFALAVVTAGAGLAAEFNTFPVTFPTKEGDMELVLPLPVWQDVSDMSLKLQAEVEQSKDGESLYIDMMPPGQSMQGFTHVYGVFVQANWDGSEMDAANDFAGQYVAACEKDNIRYGLINNLGTDHPVAYAACGRRIEQQTGALKTFGQISLSHFRKSGTTMVRVYHQWIVKPFTAAENATWPVPGDALVQRGAVMEAAMDLHAKP